MKDLKYLLACIAPLAAYLGIYCRGIWSLGAILPKMTFNYPTIEEPKRLSNRFFDPLEYLNIPLFFGLLCFHLID